MNEAIKVGAETQGWCTACRDMQWHVVVALVGARPVKVECVHCHKQHRFRADPPGATPAKGTARATSARPAAGRTPGVKPAAEPALDVKAATHGKPTLPYDPQRAFAGGEVVRHPSFGIGIVTALRGPQKVEVTFPIGAKLLAHDRASLTAGLTRPPPAPDSDDRAVTDAPRRPPRGR